MGLSPLASVKLDRPYSVRLKEVYHLEEGPETLEELAQFFNRSFQSAAQTFKGKEWLEALVQGRVAYGESKRKTRHNVRFQGGHSVNLYCSLDALIEGFFQDVEVESSCPHCEETILLSMVGREIVSKSPGSTVLWLGISPHGGGPTTEALCPFINFFSSDEHAARWRELNPGQVGALLTLSQAMEFAKIATVSVPSLLRM